MLGRGNHKLGPNIFSWSLPPILSCPGRSSLCQSVCYGLRAHFTLPAIGIRLRANLQHAMASDFPERVCRQLRRLWAQVVRVHVVGDFFTPEYAEAWIKIARRCEQVEFFAYTRSWRCAELLPLLLDLESLQNFQVFASCDRETGLPPENASSLRRVYMSMDDQDVPPPGAQLVFRVQRRTPLKRLGNTIVCPAENGVSPITCTQCRLCWRVSDWWRQRIG